MTPSTLRRFFDKVRLVAQHVPSDWGILLLGFWLKNGPSGHAVNAHVHRVHDFCLTHAYLITRAAALELLARTPVDAPLDTWLSRQSYDIPIYRHTYELGPRTTSTCRWPAAWWSRTLT